MNMNSKVDPRLESAALKFAENLEKYPAEEQYAVGVISKNVLNGCSWEFVRKNPGATRLIDAFNKNPNCSIQEVVYNRKAGVTGYLVYMNLSYLCSLLGKEAPGLLNQRDLMLASEHRKEAILSLAKRIQSGYKGLIGIFCTNDSQSITVDSHTYPAYTVSLREMLQVCQRYNYGIVIRGGVRTPSQVAQREDDALKELIVAPSSNALFVNIAPLK